MLAAGVDPTAHWFQFGQNEGRTAPQSSVFNRETYNLLNPDVAAAGVDPLQHWLNTARSENRMGGAFERGLMYDQFNGDDVPGPVDTRLSPQGRRDRRNVSATVEIWPKQYGRSPCGAWRPMIFMETGNAAPTVGTRRSTGFNRDRLSGA